MIRDLGLSRMCRSSAHRWAWGIIHSWEALFSDAGDVVGEEKEEEQPQDVGRQGIGKVACVWS
jgi:hypothetical protein